MMKRHAYECVQIIQFYHKQITESFATNFVKVQRSSNTMYNLSQRKNKYSRLKCFFRPYGVFKAKNKKYLSFYQK